MPRFGSSTFRNALIAIVNTRDGEADNVWQRIARAALDAERDETPKSPNSAS